MDSSQNNRSMVVGPDYHPRFWVAKDGEYRIEDEKDIRDKEEDPLYECSFVRGQNHYSFIQLREFVLLSLCRKDHSLQCCEICQHFIRQDAERIYYSRDDCKKTSFIGYKFNHCPSFVLNNVAAEEIRNRDIQIDEILCNPFNFQEKELKDWNKDKERWMDELYK